MSETAENASLKMVFAFLYRFFQELDFNIESSHPRPPVPQHPPLSLSISFSLSYGISDSPRFFPEVKPLLRKFSLGKL